jgi:hypothetical protein
MEHIVGVFSDFSFFQLHAVLAGALLFAMLGARALVNDQINGFLLLMVSLVFFVFHSYLLFNMPSGTWSLDSADFLGWLTQILAPALILLILAIGSYDLLCGRFLAAVLKLLLGFSLTGILFSLGQEWPIGFQVPLVLLWMSLWFMIELKTAQ